MCAKGKDLQEEPTTTVTRALKSDQAIVFKLGDTVIRVAITEIRDGEPAKVVLKVTAPVHIQTSIE